MSEPYAPTFPDIDLPHLANVAIPPLARVKIRQPAAVPPLADVKGAIRAALDAEAGLFDILSAGAAVAVAVGSRGIADIDLVARTAVDWLKGRGLAPFIVPAMGSHGGGTAEGQLAVLAALGVTEETMGCPVRATMETVVYGEIGGGLTCHFDAMAAAAAGVLAIARVKAHTSFPRPVESGLTKMLAVGLGKAEGARQVHMIGPRGFTDSLPRLAARIVERAPLSAGLALVENAGKQLCHVEVAAPRAFYAVDERLLVMARGTMARLPFRQIDGLIVEEIGKEISGAGMDPAVCGRTDIRGVENPAEPFVHKIVVLGLSARTGGNGMGVGLADYIPRGLAEQLDLRAMYMNAVTATILEKAHLPIVLPDDRACLKAMVATCWATGPARICQIRSTASLTTIAVSESLLAELRAADMVLGEEPPRLLDFDDAGRLLGRLGDAA